MANANMSASLLDLMSSPDPLNDSADDRTLPSLRRSTRSQATPRLFALGSTPRKRTFELDVGNKNSPQKILVTVEAEDTRHGGDDDDEGGVSRQLFQSPSNKRVIRRREKAVTTTVPLRGLTDDEADDAGPGSAVASSSTPGRRGRTPKTATPASKGRKRTGTPIRRTPGRPRQAKGDVPTSDITVDDEDQQQQQATPKARSQTRSPAKRRKGTPAKPGPTPEGSTPRRRGRPRKHPLSQDNTISFLLAEPETAADAEVEDNDNDNASLPHMEDNNDDNNTASTASHVPAVPSSDQRSGNEMTEDIWLADIDGPSTSGARRWSGREEADRSMNVEQQEQLRSESALLSVPSSDMYGAQEQEREEEELEQDQEQDDGGADFDYGGAESHSEAESQADDDDHRRGASSPRQDTVMAGEEFTMISIGSLPMMQANSSRVAADADEEEFGEATSLIINRTLESLRQSRSGNTTTTQETGQGIAEEEEQEEEEEEEREEPAPAQEPDLPAAGADGEEPEDELPQPEGPSIFSQPGSSRPWSWSPKRSSAIKAQSQTQTLGKQLAVKSLSLQRESGAQQSSGRLVTEESGPSRQQLPVPNEYEDSFSEIPEAGLEAATPGRVMAHARHAAHARAQVQVQVQVQVEVEEEDPINSGDRIQPSIEQTSTVNHSNSPPVASNKLLTPDETPSPASDNEGDQARSASKSTATSELRSSPPFPLPSISISAAADIPPRQNPLPTTARRNSRTGSTETPFEQPSPPLPPHGPAIINPQIHNIVALERHQRPMLSPIVRAGRALQLVTSDPPSPPERDSVLGSPFRGSKSSQSPAPSARRATQSPASSTPPASHAATHAVHAPTQSEPSPVQRASPWSRALAPLHQIKNMVVQGAQAFSPRQPPQPLVVEESFAPVPAAAAAVTQASSAPGSTAHHRHHLSPDDAADPASSSSSARHGSSSSSTKVAFPSDDATNNEMSWQPEGSAAAARAMAQAKAKAGGRYETRKPSIFAARGSSGGASHQKSIEVESRRGFEETVHRDEILLEQDEPAEEEEEEEDREEEDQGQNEAEDQNEAREEEEEEAEEEDDDIWAIEAQRPTPASTRRRSVQQQQQQQQQQQEQEQTTFEPPRRSKLPSPWRQNSRRLSYNDERRKLYSGSSRAQEDVSDEFSMLSQQSRDNAAASQKEKEAAAQSGAGIGANAKKADLSAFFSSPAILPDVQPPTFGLFKALDARKGKPEAAQASKRISPRQDSELELPKHRALRNSELLRREQQSTGETSVRAMDRPTAIRPQPQPQPRVPSIPQKDFQMTRERSVDLFSPVKGDKSRDRDVTSASFTAPEQPKFAHVPQKSNFTPRPRQTSHSLRPSEDQDQGQDQADAALPRQNSLFTAPAPSSLFFTQPQAQPQPQPQPARGRIRDMLDQDQDRDRDELGFDPDTSFEAPSLKPLPPRAASPSKSCMRSPLKPKTPGHVVEFTSSTLSPLAQARARAERRSASASPEKDAGPSGAANKPGFVSRQQQGISAAGSSKLFWPAADQEEDKENGEDEEEEEEDRQVEDPEDAEEEEEEEEREQEIPAQREEPAPMRPSAATVHNDNNSKPPGLRLPNQPQTQTQPQTQPQTRPHTRLSQTQWSKDHWIRLDELTRERRRSGALAFQLRHAVPYASSSCSAAGRAKRQQRPLLGKQVSAQGETMVLEGWHLDVVDAFRAEVGGWDEKVLAKRLFALLVGEGRRRAGKVRRRAAGV